MAERGGGGRRRRELGCSHREFFRCLPPALEGWEWGAEGRRVEARRGAARLRIELGAEGERRIASLSLPVTPVELHFEGLDEPGIEAFMARLWRCFQRGGG